LAAALAVAAEEPVPLPDEPKMGERCNVYVNRRFGFRIKFPVDLIAGRFPQNGAGRAFSTPDHEFSIIAEAHFLPEDDSLERWWKEATESKRDLITFKKKGKSWYVVSGVNEMGIEFYTKFCVKERNWASFTITYPHAKNKKYDPWVENIEKSFVPFLEGKDFDRIR
jgi:hypothetical protein